jgi:DNA-binding PadR family transcriptional regulator
LFGFVAPPAAFFVALAVLLGAYLVLAETVKNWFYKRHAYRLEQALIPKRTTVYLTRTARLVQDIVAVISLRLDDEISIDSLLEDLKNATSYPINPNQVMQNLQHLRRAGIISVDWNRRTIKREKPLKEYIKTVIGGEMWPTVIDDWDKLSRAMQGKYGSVNMEYRELLSSKQT